MVSSRRASVPPKIQRVKRPRFTVPARLRAARTHSAHVRAARLLAVRMRAASACAACLCAAGMHVPGYALEDAHPGSRTLALAVAAPMDLHLDVWLNASPRGVHAFSLRNDELWASAATLRRIGISVKEADATFIRLADIDGIFARFDSARQRVDIDAAGSRLDLPLTTAGQPLATHTPASSGTGALLNYDLYGTRQSDGASSLSLFSELRAFSGNTVASSTALTQTVRGAAQYRHSGTTRLDTRVSTSFQDSMLTLTLGDTITRSLNWTRPTRIGGIQLGRNFGLQPYRPTAPLPAFFGNAALPSSVELYIDGLKHYSGDIPPGPFQLNAMPGITGAGRAHVVLADALGRLQTLDFSLYDSQRLLQKGLSDWSVELGLVRKQYGLKSFSYDSDVAGSASIRHGLSNTLTAEAHLEGGSGLVNAGVGAVWVPGMSGVLSASLAGSRHEGRQGRQWSAGYEWTGRRFNAGVNAMGASTQYRDLASLHGARTIRRQARAHAGYTSPQFGSTGVSYLSLQYDGQQASRYGSVYWFKALGQRASLGLTVNQNLDNSRDRAAFLGLTISLDGNMTASAGLQRDRGRNAATLDVARPLTSEGGWGWRASANHAASRTGWQAQADYLGRYGQLTAGAMSAGGIQQAYAGASGAVVLMDGQAFASRRISDGFAVVSTSGFAGVPVRLDNRPVGVTGRGGHLLVTPVHAWQRNRIDIDTLGLPADVQASEVVRNATPAAGAGSLETFALRRIRAASISLRQANGAPLPVGTTVRHRESASQTVSGFDGLVYLEDLADHNTLEVAPTDDASGTQNCIVRFDYSLPGRSPGVLGPYTCTP